MAPRNDATGSVAHVSIHFQAGSCFGTQSRYGAGEHSPGSKLNLKKSFRQSIVLALCRERQRIRISPGHEPLGVIFTVGKKKHKDMSVDVAKQVEPADGSSTARHPKRLPVQACGAIYPAKLLGRPTMARLTRSYRRPFPSKKRTGRRTEASVGGIREGRNGQNPSWG
jgi:hypothetical protein